MKEKQKNSYWYSKIDSYRTCPRKYLLSYVRDIKEPSKPSGDLLFGSAIHIAMEAMLEGDDYVSVFEGYWNWVREQPVEYGRFGWEYLLSSGLTLLRKFHKRLLPRIKVVGMEKRQFGKVDRYKFEGTPDIWGEFDGVPSVMDFKTTGYPYDKDKIMVADQLVGYAHLLDKYPVKQIIYFPLVKRTASIQTPLILPLTEDLKREIMDNTKDWIDKIQSDKLYPKNTGSCIRGPIKCGYFDICWRNK